MKNSDSPSKQVWKRFLKNRLAVGGLVFILMLILVCLLGYLITPDQSPHANEMHLQLTNRKPGRSFRFLIISRNDRVKQVNFLEKMLYGQELNFKSIPVTSLRKLRNQIYAREYIGDDEIAEEKAYPKVPGEYEYEKKYWLGTDIYGRDLLSRLIIGTRVSLSVGLMAVLISLFIGVSLGAIAGYVGGKTDASISWLMNVIWSLPSLLLVIAISFALGKGFWQIFIAVGLSTWVDVARLVRGQVMVLKEVEFVEASRALGFSTSRIIRRHILPNIAGPILVVSSANFAAAILLETGLSFLGFGAQPPMPSWGTMIKEHYGYIIMDAAYLAVLPGLAIMLTVYSFNLLAIGLRDAFDVKSQNISV
ncbi:oligopeptide transport system permease protein [Pedobacter sp. UYP24]